MDRFGELKVFTQVVEARGFSGAARAAGLTPSAVSKLIARLEARLGVLLFHRSSRQVGLTREGERFYDDARNILTSLDEAESALAGDSATASGLLRAYVLPTFARCQLAPRMPAFLAHNPKLSIEFQLGNEPLRTLDSNIDVAIQGGRLQDSALMVRRIATSRWVLCASPAYLAARGAPNDVADLEDHPCLTFAVGGDWNSWTFHDGHGELASHVPKGRLSSNHGDMVLAAALAGVGIARLTEFHVAEELRTGRLVRVLPQYHSVGDEPVYAIHHARRHISPRVRLFLDFLSEEFTQNPPWAGVEASCAVAANS